MRKIIIGLVIILVIAMVVLITTQKETKIDVPTTTITTTTILPELILNPQECEGNGSCIQQSATDLAAITGDIDACEQAIEKTLCHDNYYKNEAYVKQNLIMCDSISTQEGQISCRDAIYFSKSKSESDRNYCLLIQDEKLRKLCQG